VIPDGSVLVQDGVIVEVGSTRRVENLALARKAIEISAVGRVVMPGFVDSHTHLLYPPAGSFPSDCEAGARTIQSITGLRLQTRARLHLETMARHGTTTVEVKSGCGPDGNTEMKLLRVAAAMRNKPVDIVATFLIRLPRAVSEEMEGVGHECRRISEEVLPKVRRRRLARFVDFASEEWCAGMPLCGPLLEAAGKLGFSQKVHAAGIAPSSAIAAAVAQGAVSVDHIEHATAADAALLAHSNTIATLLPCASFHSDGRYAPARTLIDSGGAVALATNFNPHHTPTLNMQTAIKLACVRMGMTPAEAVSAATINGAHAVGCADRAGSLTPGKQADLLILNISDYRELAHHFGTNLVHRTLKRGELIYEEGEVAPRPARDLRPGW